ncbi:SDR family NAD(P)-dependent oxidoreductase [Rhodococcus sp. WAY2]|uniref:SDR family NAD(P)-dependent oxidoreductase n=1 Tax=Rhodococcus sp. WAY2 TaxID=2663121 RepID=UPI00131F55DF|nr:SDR family NAD(P)-dependent oxidoreductase [Rhodococcus sp. WAY2]QHE73329.1 3-oxoacyl-[acyl-carrier protein] reductase [Rhodococcus sp. WAY2]
MIYTSDQIDLTGRSALVTGAGSGIGSMVARALATAGAAVLVADANASAAAAVADRIVENGGNADHVRLDTRDRAAAEAAADRASGLADGILHILVNYVGITVPPTSSRLMKEALQWMLDIHLVGIFHCSNAVRPFLPIDGTGRIINVPPLATTTEALGSKIGSGKTVGIAGLTRSLSLELAQHKVLVNVVAPLVLTQRPEGVQRYARPAPATLRRNGSQQWSDDDAVAGAVVLLASDSAPPLTGQVLPLGGGGIAI